ncbi:MAG: cobalt-precorrin-6A reductase [Cyanobacteria bacterium SID2]|nr:cobalt-precorrin-6A reductase [Cyanobacteria bacterium SID2]MBP0004759.1 cobalt-precorrin-6A reductase [Cyanobacteria bacterium SBC]
MSAIWLIGGTSESREIAHRLSREGFPWVVTVTTPSAVRLYRNLLGTVEIGPLSPETIDGFLDRHSIDVIIDASHPFSTSVSKLAISTGLPYLRFERPRVPLPENTLVLRDLPSLLEPQYLQGRRILLTLGVQALSHFSPWLDRCQLWARILPDEASIRQGLDAGFPHDRLIPQRLPISLETECQLWKKLRVDTVVTKAAGVAGGVDIKQAAARVLNVHLVVLDRPKIDYPKMTSNPAKIFDFIRDKYPIQKTKKLFS